MKAEETVRTNMEEKKEKLAEEMKRREDRFKVFRKESQERNQNKKQTHKERIEEKKKKVHITLFFLIIFSFFCRWTSLCLSVKAQS